MVWDLIPTSISSMNPFEALSDDSDVRAIVRSLVEQV